MFNCSDFLDEEEEDDVVTPKPPIEPEEEKIFKKDEENDSKGILKNLTLNIFGNFSYNFLLFYE